MLVLAAVVAVLGYLERHTIYRQVMLAVVADTASDTSDPEHQALEVLGRGSTDRTPYPVRGHR
jgi:hypothetical protein